MPTQEINGTVLHYRQSGSGQAVVLVHGYPLDQTIWQGQMDHLPRAIGSRIITPDLRGFGESIGGGSFTIESLADDLHALLKKIDALPCVLGGLSMGGYVSLAFAKKYPRDLRGLILIDTRAEADTPDGKIARDVTIELAKSKGSHAIAAQMLPKMVSPATTQARPQVVRHLRAIMESCPPQTIQYAAAAMRDREDYTGLLPLISVPVLIVVGDSDFLTPREFSEKMHSAIPGSKLTVIPAAGHMTPLEQPAQVTLAIKKFLNRSTAQAEPS